MIPVSNTWRIKLATAPLLDHEEQTVIFQLGKESYGIDVFRVTEIIRLREITSIPRSESHLRGLVNLRGKTIPVVDLRARFALTTSDDDESTRIIVIDTEQGNVGIVVDAVREVLTLTPDEVESAPPMVGAADADFIRGVARCGGRLITLLDLDKALSA
jgi:purine-binding chemotaxis protein CheW